MERRKSADSSRPSPVKGCKRVVFTYNAAPGSEVFVAGDFNQWNPQGKKLSDRKGDGCYRGIAMLPKGRYEYKLVVDGKWRTDPNCADWVPNDQGSINSVIEV